MEDQRSDDSVEVEDTTIETDWKNAPEIQDLKDNLEGARQDHDRQTRKIGVWLDNLHIEGDAKPKARQGRSQVQPRLIRKQAEWRYPALSEPFLSTDKVFQVSPRTWEDKNSAVQNELILNQQFNNEIDKVPFVDSYVRTVVEEGTAIVRVGWEYHSELVKEMVPVYAYEPAPELEEMLPQLIEFQQENPTGYEHEIPEEVQESVRYSMEWGSPVRAVITEYEEVEVEKTVANRPTLEVCDYRNIIIDPSCNGNLKKAGFIINSFESSKAELKKDGKYENIEKIDLNNNSPLGDPDHETENETAFTFNDDSRKKFVVYEYWGFWDIHGDGTVVPIVAAWVGNTLIRLEESPFPDKELPFVSVQYLPVRRKIYGEPDGHLLEDNQRIVGAVTRGMIDLLGKSANAQTGTTKGSLDSVNKRKLARGEDYELNAGHHPDQAIFQHKYPEIPQSASFMVQSQNHEAESLSGVKAFSEGLSSSGLGDVATGIRGVLDAASKRETSILRRLADGMVSIARKIISMNAEFLDDEEVVRITNDSFVALRRDDLKGAFDLKLSISTAEEDNAKAERLSFLLQTIGNRMDQKVTMKMLAEIYRLQKMPDLAKEFEDWEPEPDPVEQERLMLENQLLKAKIAVELSKAQGNEAGAQLDMAKISAEIAKASKLQSDTDRNNLDFVEQESGVKQERDLERVGEQARSNMELEKFKHQLEREDADREQLREWAKNFG